MGVQHAAEHQRVLSRIGLESPIGSKKEAHGTAGDDNPFFRYKRQKFLARFLSTIEFNSKVLEVGPGPGGNLLQIVRPGRPRRVIGIDISSEMLDLTGKTLKGSPARWKPTKPSAVSTDLDLGTVSTWASGQVGEHMIRRLLDSPNHLEGEPFGLPLIVALKLLLLFIRPLDNLIPDKSRSDQDGLR
jgi:hypothetical protein